MEKTVRHGEATEVPPNEQQATTSAAPASGTPAGSPGQEAPAAP
jgi:hypothetical protein